MKRTLALVLLALSALTSISARANFNIPGTATVTYHSGSTKQIDFSFAFKKSNGSQHFIAGPYKMATDEVPEQYTLAVLITKGGNGWVQEFGQGYFKSFIYKLGKHTIEMRHSPDRDVKGNYTLIHNGRSSLFETNTAQIVISFDNDGIKKIKLQGTTKDLKVAK